MSPRPKRKRNIKNNDSENDEISLGDVMAKLVSIEKNQNNKIDGIISTLDVIQDTQSKLQENYDAILKKTKEQAEGHEELKSQVEDNTTDIEYIQTDLDKINYKLNCLMQEKLGLNLIISGVPKNDDEDIKEVVSSIFTSMGAQLQGDSISASWRIHNRNEAPPVIVKLKNKGTKDSILNLRKSHHSDSQHKGKSLYAKDFGFDSEKQIYINEELTQHSRNLLNTAKKLLKEKANFKFIWTSDGKILAKKDENSKVILIRNKWEVQQLIKRNNGIDQTYIPTPSGSGTQNQN